jgi:hypothetical protein
MEAGDSIVPEDDDHPRSGILSALESARHRKPLPHIRGEDVRQKSAWSSRLLVGLMATGVVALLGGFIMVVREGHSEAAVHAALAEAAATQAATASASAPAMAATTATTAAAVIESPAGNTLAVLPPPPAQAATQAATPMPMPTTPTPTTAATAPLAVAAAATAPATATASRDTRRTAALAPAQAAAPVKATPGKAEASDKPARSAKKRQADADVALLEAMFHHTQAHPPAAGPGPSVTDQIRSACGSLVGAAAATCRARICVNNPAARACHDGE